MPLATHLLVGNPTAQSGRNAGRIASARVLLDAARLPHTLLPTLPHGGTIGAVRDALLQGPWTMVIAMGGDGTFSEVARGLHASGRAEEIALGMLPTGTANDQGRSFGLSAAPSALEHNLSVITDGYVAPEAGAAARPTGYVRDSAGRHRGDDGSTRAVEGQLAAVG